MPGAIVPRAAAVSSFIQRAFGGQVVDRHDGPDGEVSQVLVDGAVVMRGEPAPGDRSSGTDAGGTKWSRCAIVEALTRAQIHQRMSNHA